VSLSGVKVWLNGGLVDEKSACVSPADHGLLVGDGVFETLRCYAGVPFALDEHLGRLEAGATALGLTAPPRRSLHEATRAVIEANGLADARMRITLTSGPGPPGLLRGDAQPTLLVSARPVTPWPATATAVVSRWRRDQDSPLAGVKTISLVESVMALAEARAAGAAEGILPNRREHVCEATTANVFVVRGGRVETPSPASGCLRGITRDRVLGLCAELGLGGGETEIPASALQEADELFLTSSTREVQPVVELDGRPVGSGEPGETTRRLADAYRAMVLAQLNVE
jgi:branched-chain amino acid aminotransferase